MSICFGTVLCFLRALQEGLPKSLQEGLPETPARAFRAVRVPNPPQRAQRRQPPAAKGPCKILQNPGGPDGLQGFQAKPLQTAPSDSSGTLKAPRPRIRGAVSHNPWLSSSTPFLTRADDFNRNHFPKALKSFRGLLPATNLTGSRGPSSEPPRPHRGPPRACTPLPKEMQQVFCR